MNEPEAVDDAGSNGLESAIVRFRSLDSDMRMDSQYFRQRYLHEDRKIRSYSSALVNSFAKVTDGPHGYHEVDENSAIVMLTAKSARGWFAFRGASETISTATHEANLRSSLKTGDVILSTRGTVGLAALVDASVLPANIDQDVAKVELNSDAPVDAEFVVAYLNSRYGQDWMTRNSTGMVQQGLSLSRVRSIPVPIMSDNFRARVSTSVRRMRDLRSAAAQHERAAEDALERDLGVDQVAETTPRTQYQERFSQVKKASRLDSEFFSPRVQAIIELLGGNGTQILDVASLEKDRFVPRTGEEFGYIEIGDITPEGELYSRRLDGSEAPTRATWYVRAGFVITSTVRPRRRLTAVVQKENDGFVCSSGYAVLDPFKIEPEVLMAYLRMPVVCELMDLYSTASMYPTISTKSLMTLPFAIPSGRARSTIVAEMAARRTARLAAEDLGSRITRAVETAIEDSEHAALLLL